MLETSARLLRLLSLLQARRDWSGAELADRLGVTTRTVRNDVGRLRRLGYPVDATPGVAGGYRLGAGAALPPLLLDDDEAVAIAVGLRTAASGGVAGIEEASVRALTKLEQVLPSRLRHRVGALHAYTVPGWGGGGGGGGGGSDGPQVDPDVLVTIAGACRDHERMRFDYLDHDGAATTRLVEPHRLVAAGRRWYLVAWDLDRDAWRTFRVDRVEPRANLGPRFTPRPLPDDDVARYVARGAGSAMWRHRAEVILHAPASAVAARLPPAVELSPIDDHTCRLHAGSDTWHLLAVYLGMLDVGFDVVSPPELLAHVHALGARYRRARNVQDGSGARGGGWGMADAPINIGEALASFDDVYSPRILARVNDYDVRVAHTLGDHVWHVHDDTDEFFLVLDGEFHVALRPTGSSERTVVLRAGDTFVVPRGTEHRPSSPGGSILMFEPTGTSTTGDRFDGALPANVDSTTGHALET